MGYQICLLPGDGIGPEVVSQAEAVLKALPLEITFIQAAIGFGAYQRFQTPLPDETIKAVQDADAALLGAVTTPPGIPDYFSPVVRLRQVLDLYANIRPCRSVDHPISRPGIDLIIVRENTEGLYSGIEHSEDGGDRAVSQRVITRRASERVIRKAYEIARQEGRTSVTVVHKANILRQTCGLFRQVALEIAAENGDIHLREMLVDTCAMELIRAPEQFEVIVTTNLFGDILSDEACMLVGGLGLAHSGNIGPDSAVFEPVHGSAPDIAGQGKANPAAAILSAALLMDHLGETAWGDAVRRAVSACLKRNAVTADLGGNLTTTQMTESILNELRTHQG